jgi:hypothetical protein
MLDNDAFTDQQKEMIKGSCDFYSVDWCTSYLVTEPPKGSAACVANSSHLNFPGCARSSSVAAGGSRLGPTTVNVTGTVGWAIFDNF